MKTLRVILYGSNLVMSTIWASLRDRAKLLVVPVDGALTQVAQRLCALEPDVVVFALAGIQPDWTAEVLKSRPQVILIGVDITGDKSLVLRGEFTRLWTTDDLVHLIENQGGRCEE